MSSYVYIETTTKLPAKIKQIPFESAPQVQNIQTISPIHPHYFKHVNLQEITCAVSFGVKMMCRTLRTPQALVFKSIKRYSHNKIQALMKQKQGSGRRQFGLTENQARNRITVYLPFLRLLQEAQDKRVWLLLEWLYHLTFVRASENTQLTVINFSSAYIVSIPGLSPSM